jgi:hypothetical protein
LLTQIASSHCRCDDIQQGNQLSWIVDLEVFFSHVVVQDTDDPLHLARRPDDQLTEPVAPLQAEVGPVLLPVSGRARRVMVTPRDTRSGRC